jgi:hypothetical protein
MPLPLPFKIEPLSLRPRAVQEDEHAFALGKFRRYRCQLLPRPDLIVTLPARAPISDFLEIARRHCWYRRGRHR